MKPSQQHHHYRKASTSKLRKVLRGQSKVIPMDIAMSLLVKSNYPNALCVLQHVLENEDLSASTRAIAASALANLCDSAVQGVLLKNINLECMPILLEIIKALGKVGDKKALPALKELEKPLESRREIRLLSLVLFSQQLIYHRESMSYKPESVKIKYPYIFERDCTLSARQVSISEQEFDNAIMAIQNESYGIKFSENQAYVIKFENIKWLILLNDRIFNQCHCDIGKRNSVLGIVAEWSEQEQNYNAQSIMLSSPSSKGVDIYVYEFDGELSYCAQGTFDRKGLSLHLRTVSDTVLPIDVKARFENQRLDMHNIMYTRKLRYRKKVIPL